MQLTYVQKNEIYSDAMAAVARQDWDAAISCLNKLDDFKDSKSQLKRCEYKRRIALYEAAEAAYEANDWNKAIRLFAELGEHKDSESRLTRICEIQKAEREKMFSALSNLYGAFEQSVIAVFTSGTSDCNAPALRLAEYEAALQSMFPIAEEVGASLEYEYGRIPEMRKLVSQAGEFAANRQSWNPSYLIPFPEHSYGKPDAGILQKIRELSPSDAYSYVQLLLAAIRQSDYETLSKVDLCLLACSCWSLAMAKPFSSEKYGEAQDLLRFFEGALCCESCDDELSQLYTRLTIAGEDVVVDSLRGNLPFAEDVCAIMASFFMWMGASRAETAVLEHMLINNLEQTQKMQERLRLLKDSGGEGTSIYEVASGEGCLYFDATAITWDADTTRSFFNNLAFQDKQLSYSLVMRDEDKKLSLASAALMPSVQDVFGRLRESMLDEFGDEVRVSKRQCASLADSSHEEMSAILIETEACECLGLLLLLIPLGKKLTIKQYTLYMPTGQDLSKQAEVANSLHAGVNLSAAVWEDGLKSAALDVIQKMLNEDPSDGAVAGGPTKPEAANIVF